MSAEHHGTTTVPGKRRTSTGKRGLLAKRRDMAFDMPEGTSLESGERLIIHTDLPGQDVWLTNLRLMWARRRDGEAKVTTLAVPEIARVRLTQATSARRVVGGLLVVLLSVVGFGVAGVLGVIVLAAGAFVIRSASQRELQAVRASGEVAFSVRVMTRRSASAVNQLHRALSDLLADRSDSGTPAT